MILKRADYEIGERVQSSDGQLKYFKPQKVRRAEKNPILLDVAETIVLKTSWPGIDRRESEANMFAACDDRFGVMPHVCSYEVTGEHGQVISNILFFPEPDKIKDYHWNIFSSKPPAARDIRTYNHSVLGPHAEGKLLNHAESPYQLSRSLAHALLGAVFFILLRLQWLSFPLGWLSVYLSGYLHRDVSLGNLFLLSEGKEEGFEIPTGFWEHLSSLEEKESVKEIEKQRAEIEEIKKQCAEIKEMVVKMKIPNKACAVIGDGDLAINWESYFDTDRRIGKSVSHFLTGYEAGIDEVYRVHLSSCPGRSLRPKGSTYIHLWMTWSRSSGLRSGP